MLERIDFIVKDSLCEKIVKELNDSGFISNWLKENQETYKSVTLQPEGLPAIGSVFCDGELFENISKFVDLYQRFERVQEGLNEIDS